ncbi:hypothetical protein [Microcystis phage Mel-JY34]
MKFDLIKALDGHPLEFDGKPITLRSIRRSNNSVTIYASVNEGDLPQTFDRDGNPLNAQPSLPLTLAQPLREVYIVLFPGNEARYLHSLEAATALAAGGKGAGPYAITVRLPWDVATRIDSERASALLARA